MKMIKYNKIKLEIIILTILINKIIKHKLNTVKFKILTIQL